LQLVVVVKSNVPTVTAVDLQAQAVATQKKSVAWPLDVLLPLWLGVKNRIPQLLTPIHWLHCKQLQAVAQAAAM
jgi:hypothetical protein